MSAVTTTPARASHEVRPLNPAQYRPALVNVGIIVWLASELMFFSGLFATYLTLRAATLDWPPFGDKVDPKTVGVATVVLVLSSGTMQLAHARQSTATTWPAFRAWLAFTWALGAIFEGMQIVDYLTRNFSPQQSAYSGAFYVLTGIHFLHVLGGLAAHGLHVLPFAQPAYPLRWRTAVPRTSTCCLTTGTSWTWCGSACTR